jgi:hypothetical protein
MREATFTNSQLFEFNAGTSDAEFLFGSDVVEYLGQIRQRAVHMRTAQQLFERLPVGDERTRHVETQHNDLVWLTDQITAMTKIFAPYLGFANIRSRGVPFLGFFSTSR